MSRVVVTGGASGIGAATVAAFRARGDEVVAADLPELDVRDEPRVAEAMRNVDVLVNAAGIGSTTSAPDTPLDVWDDVFAVNARGTFLCCKHAIPGMIERGGGSIVNVCPGTVDSPWVRRLVDEVGESIDALRARQPLGRLGTPEEIADAIVYLATAEFVTGSVLVADGGLTAA